MNLDVDVNGTMFFGRRPIQGHGFVIEPGGLEGYDDGVAVRGDSVAIPNGNGDFDTPTFLDSRIVSLSGNCLAESPQQLGWYRSKFTSLLTAGDGLVSFFHMGERRSARARLAPSTTPKFRVLDEFSPSFQLQLKFADPRLFGDTRTFELASGTAVTVHHKGNFAASPVVMVQGAMPSGYTVTGGGKTFTVTRAATAGTPQYIDMHTGQLTVGSTVVYGDVSVAQTFAVPAGGTVSVLVTPVSGSCSGTVTVRDTFI